MAEEEGAEGSGTEGEEVGAVIALDDGRWENELVPVCRFIPIDDDGDDD